MGPIRLYLALAIVVSTGAAGCAKGVLTDDDAQWLGAGGPAGIGGGVGLGGHAAVGGSPGLGGQGGLAAGGTGGAGSASTAGTGGAGAGGTGAGAAAQGGSSTGVGGSGGSGPLSALQLCNDSCTYLASCGGVGTGCEANCQYDLVGCTANELIQFATCNQSYASSCTLMTSWTYCLTAIACVDG